LACRLISGTTGLDGRGPDVDSYTAAAAGITGLDGRGPDLDNYLVSLSFFHLWNVVCAFRHFGLRLPFALCLGEPPEWWAQLFIQVRGPCSWRTLMLLAHAVRHHQVGDSRLP
jgi:hypothetical protein